MWSACSTRKTRWWARPSARSYRFCTHGLTLLLPRSAAQTLPLDLLAVGAGIQDISGLVLFDRVAGKPHDLTALPRVFVEAAP